MDSKKDQYLDYLQTLHARISVKSQRAGITNWAMLVGGVYLSWDLIARLSNYLDKELGWKLICLAYAHIHFCLLLLYVTFLPTGESSRKGSPDYRVFSKRIDAGTTLNLIGVFLFLILFATIAGTTFWYLDHGGLSLWHSRVLFGNAIIGVITVIIFVGYTLRRPRFHGQLVKKQLAALHTAPD